MFNIDSLDQDREQWFALGGPLAGVELRCRYASPEYGEKFRRLLLQKQIYRVTSVGQELVVGRDADYVLEFCRHYVTDWKGATKEDGSPAPYSPSALARVLLAVRSALTSVTQFVTQEEMFFEMNGSGQM